MVIEPVFCLDPSAKCSIDIVFNYAVAIWPVTGQGVKNTGSPIFSVNFTKSKDSS